MLEVLPTLRFQFDANLATAFQKDPFTGGDMSDLGDRYSGNFWRNPLTPGRGEYQLVVITAM